MSNAKKPTIHFAHLINVDFGITIFLLPQIEKMQKHGWQAHAVCPTGTDSPSFIDKKIIHHQVAVTRDISPVADLKLTWQLYQIFRKYKFDIVHAHSAKMELFGQIAARLAGIPIVFYTNHGLIFRTEASYLKIKILKSFAWIAARLSHHIFSQSQADLEYCIENGIYPKAKSSFLGNGIHLDAFNPKLFNDAFRTQKREELGIPLDAFVLGMVGRFVDEKGYPELWKALALLLPEFPNLQLICVGNALTNERDPVNFDLLKQFGIEKNVLVLESRRDVPAIMSIMDLFTFGSHREGFPRVLMEASSMELPIVASDIAGCREAVKPNVNGVFFTAKSAEDFAKAIKNLIVDKPFYKKLQSESRAYALQHFDVERVNERIEAVYLSFANKIEKK